MYHGEREGPRSLGGDDARGRDVQLLPHVLDARPQEPQPKGRLVINQD